MKGADAVCGPIGEAETNSFKWEVSSVKQTKAIAERSGSSDFKLDT
jgi:hypothetical protein